MPNLSRTISYFNELCDRLDLRESWEILNPFFWFMDKNVTDFENAHLYDYHYLEEDSFWKSAWFSTKFLMANLYHDMALLLRNNMVHWFDGSFGPISGQLDKDASLVIQTWIYRKDIDSFVNGALKDYIWDGLHDTLKQKHLKYQVILTPLFKKPKRQEIARLVDAGAIVVIPRRCRACRYLIKTVLGSLRGLPRAIKHFRRPDWILAYVACIFSPRYWSSVALYHELKSRLGVTELKVLLPWEGQPEHKALCMAFADSGAEVMSYVHSCLNNNQSFLNKVPQTRFRNAYPKKLFVHGTDIRAGLTKVGWSEEDIIHVRSLRFQRRRPGEFRGNLYLPYAFKNCLLFIDFASACIRNGAFRVARIVPHPALRTEERLRSLIAQVPLVAESEDIVVCGFSTVILEALEAGCGEIIQLIVDKKGIIDETTYPSLDVEKINENIYKVRLAESKMGNLINFDSPATIGDFLTPHQ